MIRLELPWPPSVNHYYRRVGNATLISKEGRRYRKRVASDVLLARSPRVEGRLSVRIVASPPDQRRRDLTTCRRHSSTRCSTRASTATTARSIESRSNGEV